MQCSLPEVELVLVDIPIWRPMFFFEDNEVLPQPVWASLDLDQVVVELGLEWEHLDCTDNKNYLWLEIVT